MLVCQVRKRLKVWGFKVIELRECLCRMLGRGQGVVLNMLLYLAASSG